MGRKKLNIKPIQDEKSRHATFNKRKSGLMKKAYELGVLCDAEVALVMITPNRRLIQYSSTDMDQILLRYTQHGDAAESRNNNDFVRFFERKAAEGRNDNSDDEIGFGSPVSGIPSAQHSPNSAVEPNAPGSPEKGTKRRRAGTNQMKGKGPAVNTDQFAFDMNQFNIPFGAQMLPSPTAFYPDMTAGGQPDFGMLSPTGNGAYMWSSSIPPTGLQLRPIMINPPPIPPDEVSQAQVANLLVDDES